MEQNQNIKIYVPNVLPSKIDMNSFCENFRYSTKTKLELSSLDFGIHIVEKDDIYRIEPSFKEHYNVIKNYNGIDLLIDENKEIRVPVVSQLPSEFIIVNKIIYEFKQSFKPNVFFIIECVQQKCKVTLDEIMVPVDFYFSCNKSNFDIDNIFFQDEINKFLSMLN